MAASPDRASVSPPSLAQDPNLNAIREKASVPGSKYAFLVHSTDSLANGEDPSIDNKPLARQKRRRTSPEDQAILEAAFERNPKPDKASRMALVERVALGEKEVQIWFQNRRQSTRRKTQPLDSKEKSPVQWAGAYSSPYAGPSGADSRPQHQESGPVPEGLGRPDDGRRASVSPVESGAVEGDKSGIDEERRASQLDNSQNASGSFSEVLSSQAPPSSQESNSGRWLSNRRSAAPFRSFHESIPQSGESSSQPTTQEAPKEPPATDQNRSGLKKTASMIRLSFGADGTAIVRNGDSPSPPRKALPPPSTPGESIPSNSQLHRSYSSTSLSNFNNEPGSQERVKSHSFSQSLSNSQSQSQSLRRVSSFRSHDSRTWEFFCDREVRTELAERAEQEQSGSAADAIKLARSNSGRSTAGTGLKRTLSNKRTITPYAEVSSAKRVRTAAPAPSAPSPQPLQAQQPQPQSQPQALPASTPFKEPLQPLMQRSASATNPRRTLPPQPTPGYGPKHKTPKLKQTPTFDFPTTDSDKENWSPEREFRFIQSMTTSPAVPPTTVGRKKAPVAHTPLRRGASPTKGGSTIGSSVRRRREFIEVDDEEYDDDDDDVARFMGEEATTKRGGAADREEQLGRKRTSRQSDSVSEEEDLDCVQGLLSLSQGAWR